MNTITVQVQGKEVNVAPNTGEAPMPTIENVRSVYSGAHGCMCGCLGKHKYNPKFVTEAGENRGYMIDEEEISQRSVKTIITKVLKAGPQTYEGKEKQFIFAETPTRSYVVYFAEEVK